MKKFLSLILAFALLIASVGCSSNKPGSGEDEATAQNSLEEIKEEGKLLVGLNAVYPPFMFHTEIDGEDVVTGYEVELMRLLAEDLGVEIVLQDVDFSAILPGVETGMYDIGIGGLNPTPEREEVLDFTDIYYEGEFTLLVPKGQGENYSQTSDIEGKTIGVQTASVQENLVKDNYDCEIVSLPQVSDLVIQLQSGMVDGVVLEVPVAENYISTNDGIEIASSVDFSENDVDTGVAAAVQKGQDDLLAYINDFIARKKEDGTLDDLYAQAVELSQ